VRTYARAKTRQIAAHRVLIAVALLGLLASCGGSEKPSAPSPSASAAPNGSADDDSLRDAVQAYSDAFLTGEAAAFDMLSKRCRDRVGKAEFLGILDTAKSTYGSAIPIKSFDADIQGTLARVTYTYDLKAINQDAEPWTRESGKWKQDDCP